MPMRARRRLALVLAVCCIAAGATSRADHDLEYYLPDDVDHDQSIPAPRSVIGHEVGEYHVRHDRLVAYFRALAEASPRVTIATYGFTHEKRELVLAAVTSPENHARLEEIRERHLAALSADGEAVPAEGRPVIVWMGYSVHGNESSGSNAALLVAYHLAAATGPEIDALLRNAVVLIDPCVNPDGLARFAQWANSHRGKNLVADPAHREHDEVWPGGRTNHYWFDLNRDWLLLTHPESRARLEQFHRWKPNVLTDFHEMETGSTYFFQPGVPTRQNPNTPEINLALTRRIATYHAKALDAAGSLYYTEERFDDFYYGKGSTYPDVNGGVGILFEQASSRGHLQESSFGELSFPFTIRNQFLTSLSTLEASLEMRESLLDYHASFHRSALDAAADGPIRAYVFGSTGDAAREHAFIDILRRHRIEVFRLGGTVLRDGHEFRRDSAWIVPVAQPQFRLLTALFETRTEFEDDVFYDVSTWTLPLSFDIPFVALENDGFERELVGEAITDLAPPSEQFDAETADAYAYLLEWHGYFAPRALNRLLEAEVRARVAAEPFGYGPKKSVRRFERGTIVVPTGIQEIGRDRLASLLREIAQNDGIEVVPVETGLTDSGIDLGSPNVLELVRPRPLLVVGGGVRSYEAGEVWHLLDQRCDVELSMVDRERLDDIDLGRYTHIILVSGQYGPSDSSTAEALRRWIRAGGVLISIRGSTGWVERVILGREERVGASEGAGPGSESKKEEPAPAPLPYAEYEQHRARGLISGAIFEAHVDRTHPIGFGFHRPTVPVFRNSTIIMKPERDPFATVVRYTDTPLLSGFVSPSNLERIRNTAVVTAVRLGRGSVIRFVDNPNFRGVWYGTNKLFLNAIFFGHAIKSTGQLTGAGG